MEQNTNCNRQQSKSTYMYTSSLRTLVNRNWNYCWWKRKNGYFIASLMSFNNNLIVVVWSGDSIKTVELMFAISKLNMRHFPRLMSTIFSRFNQALFASLKWASHEKGFLQFKRINQRFARITEKKSGKCCSMYYLQSNQRFFFNGNFCILSRSPTDRIKYKGTLCTGNNL